MEFVRHKAREPWASQRLWLLPCAAAKAVETVWRRRGRRSLERGGVYHALHPASPEPSGSAHRRQGPPGAPATLRDRQDAPSSPLRSGERLGAAGVPVGSRSFADSIVGGATRTHFERGSFKVGYDTSACLIACLDRLIEI